MVPKMFEPLRFDCTRKWCQYWKHKRAVTSINVPRDSEESGPEFINLFSCSTQLSMKFVLLINLKILAIFFKLLLCSTKLSKLSLVDHEKSFKFWYFYDQVKVHAQLSWAWKMSYNLGARSTCTFGILDSQRCKVYTYGQRRLWSDCPDVQADLSLRWARISEGTFSHVSAPVFRKFLYIA